MKIREASLRYEGWRVAAAASGAVFFSFASLLVDSSAYSLKPIAAEFRWTREAVSLALTLVAICIALCSPVLGALLDRVPPRRIILPWFAVFGVAFASRQSSPTTFGISMRCSSCSELWAMEPRTWPIPVRSRPGFARTRSCVRVAHVRRNFRGDGLGRCHAGTH